MSERIFKIYSLPNHPVGAADYVPPETTNELEAEWRRSVRGKNVVIMEEQAMGADVARRTLDFLKNTDAEEAWARLVGGAMLMSANYQMNRSGDNIMYRNIALPPIASADHPTMTSDEYDDMVDAELVRVKYNSSELSYALAADTFTKRQVMGLGRSMGELGVALANYPLYIDETILANQKPAIIQAEARRAASAAHDETIQLAREIGVTPSVAQFARTESPLGAHVVASRKYPTKLIRSFKDAQGAVEDENQMVV
jgi:hypothetical protein